MAKLVDALDLGSSDFGLGGSSPFIRTINIKKNEKNQGIFNVSGNESLTNLGVAEIILSYFDKNLSEIVFIEDRKGHDFRYAQNSTKLQNATGWLPVRKLKEAFLSFTDNLLDKNLVKNSEILNSNEIANIWQNHKSGKQNAQFEIWNILMFTMWQDEWM